MPEPAYKDKSSNCRPFKHINISSDGLQFLCISLCWSLLKTTSCPIADHAEVLVLAEMVFNFYALPCDFRTELRRRSLGSAGGMTWMIILCQAVLLTRYIKIAHPARTHRALTAHLRRTQKMVSCGQGAYGAAFHPCGLGTIWFIYFVVRFTRFDKMPGNKMY